MLRRALLALPLVPLRAQYEGLWEGYDGEWGHVTRSLLSLAEASPEAHFAWRPAPGVRSTAEVYLHLVVANYRLLSLTGEKVPEEYTNPKFEQKYTAKADVINILRQSMDAVKTARARLKPAGFARQVKAPGKTTTVDGVYLRIIVHANEHLGQQIAYARSNGIKPPWSVA